MAFLLVALLAAAQEGDFAARARALVEALGSDSADARGRAEADLRRLDEAAEPTLKEAEASSDPEIRVRVVRLLDRLRWNRASPIVYARPGVVTSELWLMDTRTGESRKLLGGFTTLYPAAWCPDGRRLAVRRVSDFIRILDVETGKEEELSPLGAAKSDFVQWSPDGSRVLIFSEDLIRADGTREDTAYTRLYVVDVRTRETTLLTPGDLTCHYGCWLPDGKHVVYVAYGLPGKDPFNTFDLFAVDVEGKERRRLTHDLAPKYSMQASPDGSRLAFDWAEPTQVSPESPSTGFGGTTRLGVLDFRTGTARKISSGELGMFGAQWSPDGSELLFLRESDENNSFRDLCVMRPDGTGLRVLLEGKTGRHRPLWSPDGRRILFQEDRGESYRVCVIHRDGTGFRVLADEPEGASEASWAPRR